MFFSAESCADLKCGDRKMYRARYVEIYDLLMRNRKKDYADQSAEVARIVHRRNPFASSLLDVACGTGLHLQFFVKLFDRTVGLDISEDMLRFSQAKIPGLEVRCADMREFEMGELFDAITCMFAIPHLQSVAELETTIECFARHLAPGGILIIEPWFGPDEFIPGHAATDLIKDGSRTIFRASHSIRHPGDGDRMQMVVHSVEVDPASGIHHSTDTLLMTLFTREQYETAFAKAGCDAEHLRDDRFERGLWVARRAASGGKDARRDG
ncbi:class I SAM-dependent DNA methyltransferase [Streptosporangium amethystogenes subsp. fukuiense]|uniref:Class I SAM-dependent DNA methyltransferase n=1 Tax=Streptosporangium amethystogenes subsp. fukuiense TaxID=698418 RepID=A0ABW2T9E9_9ACTN